MRNKIAENCVLGLCIIHYILLKKKKWTLGSPTWMVTLSSTLICLMKEYLLSWERVLITKTWTILILVSKFSWRTDKLVSIQFGLPWLQVRNIQIVWVKEVCFLQYLFVIAVDNLILWHFMTVGILSDGTISVFVY
jgi:hypothetical protein